MVHHGREAQQHAAHSVWSSKLGVHVFKPKHEAEKANWKWGNIVSKPVPKEDPPARQCHVNLFKQHLQLGTKCSDT